MKCVSKLQGARYRCCRPRDGQGPRVKAQGRQSGPGQLGGRGGREERPRGAEGQWPPENSDF